METTTTSFSYYVLRIAADLVLNQTITWNVVSFRYRMPRARPHHDVNVGSASTRADARGQHIARRMDERAMPVMAAACASVIIVVERSDAWAVRGACAPDG